jgi:hypothetical protein
LCLREQLPIICAFLIPLLGIRIWSSQLLLPPPEFAPLTIGAGIDVDIGADSPSPMLAWLSEATDQSLFEILMHYKPFLWFAEKKRRVGLIHKSQRTHSVYQNPGMLESISNMSTMNCYKTAWSIWTIYPELFSLIIFNIDRRDRYGNKLAIVYGFNSTTRVSWSEI